MKRNYRLFSSCISATLALTLSAVPTSLLAAEEIPMTEIVDSSEENFDSSFSSDVSEFEAESASTDGIEMVETKLGTDSSLENEDILNVLMAADTDPNADDKLSYLSVIDESDVFSDLNHEAYTIDIPNGVGVWKDNRTSVSNTTKVPNRAIAYLTLIFRDKYGDLQNARATGFFISPSEIMTCGHCLYDKDYNYGEVVGLAVTPGRNGSSSPYGTYYSTSTDMWIAYPKSYVNSSIPAACDFDWGVIKLDKNVSSTYIRLSTAGASDPSIKLIGYPAEAYDRETFLQWQATGSKARIRSNVLETNVTGSGGQSGSPLLNKKNEAVGVYGFGCYTRRYFTTTLRQWGGGVTITSGLYRQLDTLFNNQNNIESPVFRVYNPNSGEHVYTRNYSEVTNLVRAGWKDEGVAWRNSEGQNRVPVYRVYNPNAGDHHYTSSVSEYNHLRSVGWRGEGVLWYAPAKSAAYSQVYRLYNPNAKTGAHHFTTDKSEYDHLRRLGWKGEGTAFPAR